MKAATLFAALAALSPAPWARAAGPVCGVDYFGPCLPSHSGSGAPAAPSPAPSAFAGNAMDAFSLSSQDPLTQKGLRQAAQGVQPRKAAADSAEPRYAPRSVGRLAPPPNEEVPLASLAQGGESDEDEEAALAGLPQEAQGAPGDGSVYAGDSNERPQDAAGSRGPASALARMSRRAAKGAPLVNFEQAHQELQALWDRSRAAAAYPSVQAPYERGVHASTRSFGLGN